MVLKILDWGSNNKYLYTNYYFSHQQKYYL